MGLRMNDGFPFEIHLVRVPSGSEAYKITYLQFFSHNFSCTISYRTKSLHPNSKKLLAARTINSPSSRIAI